jgi:hypothetical protein
MYRYTYIYIYTYIYTAIHKYSYLSIYKLDRDINIDLDIHIFYVRITSISRIFSIHSVPRLAGDLSTDAIAAVELVYVDLVVY